MSRIISFPSPLFMFEATRDIPKGARASPGHILSMSMSALVITIPVNVKQKDVITVDIRNGNIELIERAGIAIWRSGWSN